MHGAYKELAQYYDLIFSRKDYQKESDFILQVVEKNFPTAVSLLDVGCGTGEHIKLMTSKFTEQYGVDLNEEILEVAKQKNPQGTFIQSGMEEFALNRKFDVITCLYTVFNYNLDESNAVKTLENFKVHLNGNGMIVVALYTPSNTEKKLSLHLGKDENVEIAKINQYVFDPETGLETSDFLVLSKTPEKGVDFTIEKGHQYRIYSLEKFRTMCQLVGFSRVEFYDGFKNVEATLNTKYPVAVIRF